MGEELSNALGHRGNPAAPPVQAAIERVESAARAAGLALGNISRNWEQARELYRKGYQFVTLCSDTSILVQGAQVFADSFNKEMRP